MRSQCVIDDLPRKNGPGSSEIRLSLEISTFVPRPLTTPNLAGSCSQIVSALEVENPATGIMQRECDFIVRWVAQAATV